jgi:hypothetical protein
MLALEFLDADGVNQFDFAFRGMQQQFAIQSQADAAGQDVSASGFLPNTTYLVVGQIAGNGAAANTLRAAVFAGGSTVGNFASAGFPWALTAQSSAGFNPVITQLQFSSLYEGSYTVSNVWIGSAADFFATPSAAAGDYNADGVVDTADYVMWRKTGGTSLDYQDWRRNFTQYATNAAIAAADFNNDHVIDAADYVMWRKTSGSNAAYDAWRSYFAHTLSAGQAGSLVGVPEPATMIACLAGTLIVLAARRA